MSISKILKAVFYVVFTLLALWIFISWYDIISHNMKPGDAELQFAWNFFRVFFGN